MAAAALFGEVLLGPAEQLQKNPLLDVFVFVDGRGNGPGEPFVNVRLLRQLLQELHAIFREVNTTTTVRETK